MLRLWEFPITQEDNNRALAERNENELEFQRVQLIHFFVTHREEQW